MAPYVIHKLTDFINPNLFSLTLEYYTQFLPSNRPNTVTSSSIEDCLTVTIYWLLSVDVITIHRSDSIERSLAALDILESIRSYGICTKSMYDVI